MTNDVEAYLERGWEWCDIIRETAGPDRRLLYYPDGTVRFEHRCDRGDERGVIICAPALRIGHGHHSRSRAGHRPGLGALLPTAALTDSSVAG